jgi:hypothetical protein
MSGIYRLSKEQAMWRVAVNLRGEEVQSQTHGQNEKKKKHTHPRRPT